MLNLQSLLSVEEGKDRKIVAQVEEVWGVWVGWQARIRLLGSLSKDIIADG